MTHAANKISVCSGNAPLASRQNAHVASQTRPAGRRTYNCACLNKNLQKAFFHRLQINCLGCRDHNTANSLIFAIIFILLRYL